MRAELQCRPQGLREAQGRADEGFVATHSASKRRMHRPLWVHLRALRLATILVAALAVGPALAPAPAGAVVTKVESTTVGLQPRSTSLPLWLFEHPPGQVEFVNPTGNPVVGASDTYAIYWDPTDHYHGDWQHLIDTFFRSMGASSGSLASVFAVDAQYTDAANRHALYKTTSEGAYTDTNSYPASGCEDPHPLEAKDLIGPIVGKNHTPVCLTDKQIQQELEGFLAQHSLGKGMGTIFYLLTPPGVTVCLDAGGPSGHCSDYKPSVESYKNSFCSYHSDVSPTSPTSGDANTILYGVIPWTAGGLADGHLTLTDESIPAYDCQDGGYDPSSKPIEELEKKKEKTVKEVEEFEKETPTEQAKQELKESLEGPHQQEPNQVPCPSPDGYCDTGLADLIVNQISVEQQNIVTNPLLNAWHDPSNSKEATDECRNFFAPVIGGGVSAVEGTFAGTLFNQSLGGSSYYLNTAFNLASQELPYPGIGCLPGVRLEPKFTAPNPVNTGEVVGFDGMESDITLDAGTAFSSAGVPHSTYATYTWNFGDGSPTVSGYAAGAPSANSPASSPCAAPWEAPCAASTFHSYQYGGTYDVTLTVTDVGGNTASFSEPVTVVGPAPPSGGSSSGGGASILAPSATPVAPLTAQTVAPPPSTPAPVLGASVQSLSLKKALNSGLAVRYTTSEQVAGSIQVLLDSATAKRLGVHGATATGLPAGTPRSIVVGTAVLVTTKAGQGTIHIKFSTRNASRLKHTRKLKLMLRLFARNASRQSPQTTTLLSTVVLTP
jgi:hypothetical protein